MTNINTTNDVMTAIGNALSMGDVDLLEQVERAVSDWMVDDEERQALDTLITGAWDGLRVNGS